MYHGNSCIRRYADTYQWRRTQLCNTQEKGNPCTAAGEAEKAYSNFALPNTPKTPEEYHAFYQSFDQMPFAFTDIEMIFNEDRHAVDWIFRYGNEKLAEVEHVPLTGLIGNTFGSIFSNMDDKWLCTYERATLYGERLEIMAYSPEIDTELKIICFPTFSGHCGCMLFPLDEIHCAQKQDERSQIWKNYLLKQE